MPRIILKIGNIFSVKLDENSKKYFQYIARDMSQLGSHVIRTFKKSYSLDANPAMTEIINDEVQVYVHCIIKLGINMDLWVKAGHSETLGDFDFFFKGTEDYGIGLGETPKKASDRWYIWKINEDFKNVGTLKGKYLNAFVGIVINPFGVLELMKGNKYPPLYPE